MILQTDTEIASANSHYCAPDAKTPQEEKDEDFIAEFVKLRIVVLNSARHSPPRHFEYTLIP
jgi:hypothetical protein